VKLLGIINVNFDVMDELLIRYLCSSDAEEMSGNVVMVVCVCVCIYELSFLSDQ